MSTPAPDKTGSAKKPKTGQVRNAEATKRRILDAALKEFSTLGLGGARVDTIAEKARANKGLIYAYFGSKEKLFTAVLEEAYLAIRQAERVLDLDSLAPAEALDTFIRFTWQYYLDHPEFLTLVNSENLHRGRHIKTSPTIKKTFPQLIGMVQSILDRGVAAGVFRKGVDPVQLNVTIAAIGCYYLTNRFTGSFIYDRDFMEPERLAERLAFNLETIRRLVAV
ncbi:MAG TPA: TetR family transcriptional regulator [Bauldia sp.]|nr:TetR family transcriptional regulator [Bauldia sp.]